VDIDFYTKKKVTQEMYNSDDMAKEFLMQFANQVRIFYILWHIQFSLYFETLLLKNKVELFPF